MSRNWSKQGEKVCKTTAVQCYRYGLRLLLFLALRAKRLPPEKSYSALLLTAADRCKNSFLFCVFQPYICEGSDRRGGSGADLNHVSSPVRTPWERHRLLQLQPAIQNRPTNTQNVGQHPQRSTKLSHVATEIPTGKCLKYVCNSGLVFSPICQQLPTFQGTKSS